MNWRRPNGKLAMVIVLGMAILILVAVKLVMYGYSIWGSSAL